jgi:zinc protease
METNDKEVQSFLLLGEILQMKANQKLREEMGSTYSPRVNTSIIRPPVADYVISLTVSSLPENADKIITAFDGLVQQIIKGELSDEDLQKAKVQRIKVVENFFKTNSYWSNTLEQQFSYGFIGLNQTAYIQLVETVAKEDIIAAAKRYLAGSNIIKAVMNPE